MNGSLGSCYGLLAMAEKRRLNLSFSMASPLQREAWKILSAVPVGQRTDAVCHAVCRIHERNSLLDAVRTVIREELGSVSFSTEKPQQPQEAGNIDDDVLGFLAALQNDGGEETSDSLF